jgi:hypothetical protein
MMIARELRPEIAERYARQLNANAGNRPAKEASAP